MIGDSAALIWCPFPDAEAARLAASKLLEEGLIACANILPAIESVFVYENHVSSDNEAAALFKTTQSKLDEAVAALGDIHPYDTPAIVGWGCDSVHQSTLLWLTESLTST